MNLPLLFVKLLVSVANFRLHFLAICEHTNGVTVKEKSCKSIDLIQKRKLVEIMR